MAQSYEETTNYGLSGVGNLFIYSKFLDLYNKTQLGPDDTVIIQWTEPARFDHISPNDMEWAREGSISAERFLVPGFENLNSLVEYITNEDKVLLWCSRILAEVGTKYITSHVLTIVAL
jgi:hypothetical protein